MKKILVGSILLFSAFLLIMLNLPATTKGAAFDTKGPQKTLVILVNIGDKLVPVDQAIANTLIFKDMNNYYKKNSFAKMSIEGIVVGPFTIPASINTDAGLLAQAVKAADSTVDFRAYTRIILFSPRPSPDSTVHATTEQIVTNEGTMQVTVSWGYTEPGYFEYNSTWQAITHEFGHNLGFSHSWSMDCLTCESIEGGDNYDLMGGLVTHLNAFHKSEAGWLVNTVTTSEGQYILGPTEVTSQYPQQIKIPVSSGNYYYLEFRQPYDYDAYFPSQVYSGVLMYLVKKDKYGRMASNLINYRKEGKNDKIPLLQVGNPFKDENNNLIVTLESVGSAGAHIRISRPSASAPVATQFSKNWAPSNGFGGYGSSTGSYGICTPDPYLLMNYNEYTLKFNAPKAAAYKCTITAITNHYDYDGQPETNEVTEISLNGKLVGRTSDPWCPPGGIVIPPDRCNQQYGDNVYACNLDSACCWQNGGPGCGTVENCEELNNQWHCELRVCYWKGSGTVPCRGLRDEGTGWKYQSDPYNPCSQWDGKDSECNDYSCHPGILCCYDSAAGKCELDYCPVWYKSRVEWKYDEWAAKYGLDAAQAEDELKAHCEGGTVKDVDNYFVIPSGWCKWDSNWDIRPNNFDFPCRCASGYDRTNPNSYINRNGNCQITPPGDKECGKVCTSDSECKSGSCGVSSTCFDCCGDGVCQPERGENHHNCPESSGKDCRWCFKDSMCDEGQICMDPSDGNCVPV